MQRSYLRVVFPKPGFFVVDLEVSLLVNGMPVYAGSFMNGFDWWAPCDPGIYKVETSIGGLRRKMFTVSVRAATTTLVTLAYSRIWGNFTETPVRVDLVPSGRADEA